MVTSVRMSYSTGRSFCDKWFPSVSYSANAPAANAPIVMPATSSFGESACLVAICFHVPFDCAQTL